jgi:hypothetical protein
VLGPTSCVYTYAVDRGRPTASQPDGRKLTVIYTVTGGDQEQIRNYTIDYASDLPEVKPVSSGTPTRR